MKEETEIYYSDECKMQSKVMLKPKISGTGLGQSYCTQMIMMRDVIPLEKVV